MQYSDSVADATENNSGMTVGLNSIYLELLSKVFFTLKPQVVKTLHFIQNQLLGKAVQEERFGSLSNTHDANGFPT